MRIKTLRSKINLLDLPLSKTLKILFSLLLFLLNDREEPSEHCLGPAFISAPEPKDKRKRGRLRKK